MRYFIITLVVIFSSQVKAVDSEREELSNYLRELNKIDRIFLAAKNNSSSNKSSKFKYSVFERDLSNLKNEIQTYLDLPKRSPRFLDGENKNGIQ